MFTGAPIRVVSFAVTTLCASLSASAQTAAADAEPPALDVTAVVEGPNEPQRALKQGKVVRALRASTPPTIDGRLTDEAWTLAEAASGYVQRDPDNGQPMTRPTRIQIAYDDRFLYVAVTCIDDGQGVIAAGIGRRDEAPPTDAIAIGFDPRHDHQTAYVFQTNPSGWQGDYAHFDDDRSDRDYNGVWEVRTEITDSGWTAEFQIPFSQMRFTASPVAGQVWGFNASRQIRRNGEIGTWIAKPRGQRGEVSLFGHVVFDVPITPPRRLEIVPYALARSTHRPDVAQEGGAAVGVDARVGIGTGATLSATVNPDFGQVEQDPAVLNLSVFETFFPEKRPFFLEDSRIFVPPYGLFQLFHSRRIGRTPGRITLQTGETYADRPDETTILGAAKLTGKSSAWTYGVISALTAREYGDIDTSMTAADGTTSVVRREQVIEPSASYNVVRVQRDIWGASSNVGVLVTGVIREQIEDAFTGGFDHNLRWDENRTRWDGHWAITHAPGTGGVRTSGGGISNFSVSRKHLNVGGHYDHFGRDFRVNDIGFLRTRANRNQAYGYVEAGQPDPWKAFRRIWGFSSVGGAWTNEKLALGNFFEVGTSMQFLNYWNVNVGTGHESQAYDDLDTRGGPPIVKPSSRWLFMNVNSDSRKSWRVNFFGNGSKTSVGGSGFNIGTGVTLQPSDRVQASASVTYTNAFDVAQWIKSEDVDGDTTTDYVYGALHRDVIDLTFRGTYAFTRDLTLQAYLQPFVAVGDYENIRRLARPRSFDFEPIAIATDPDFNTKSLRGNVVLRWEYIRGSTFFFVWDLSQSDSSRPGDFSPWRDLGGAFGASPTQVVMAKISYWLNR